jgi:hypothetical protein
VDSILSPEVLMQDDLEERGHQIMELDPSQEHLNGAPPSDKLEGFSMSLDDEPKPKTEEGVHAVAADDGASLFCPADLVDAMKTHTLDPPGDLHILHETHFTWEIHNYSKLPARNLSPEFDCGGFKWYSLSKSTNKGVSCSSPGETIKKNPVQPI